VVYVSRQKPKALGSVVAIVVISLILGCPAEGLDRDEDGYSEDGGDCDDLSSAVFPGAVEVAYNGIDEDCDGADLTDVDGDGFPGGPDGVDCDDGDSSIHPGADEVPYDGVDDDCNGGDLVDVDGDGHDGGEAGSDCEDTDADVHPSAAEECDGADQDCDSLIDEDFDSDGDGVTTCGPDGLTGTVDDDCAPTEGDVYPGAAEVPYNEVDEDCDGMDLTDVDEDDHDALVAGGDDCDDEDAGVSPSVAEVPYDGVDNDCAGGDLLDVDGDGWDGLEAGGEDCDDTASSTFPGAVEAAYNGIDEDCDGADLVDVDGDGYDAEVAGGTDCVDDNPEVSPAAAEVAYDGVDNDCVAGDLDDVDVDGFASTVVGGTDCNDSDSSVYPAAPETANDWIDQDCDGADLVDLDGDGFAANYGDCDDSDPSISPGAPEVENSIDDNCNEVVDEGFVGGDEWGGNVPGSPGVPGCYSPFPPSCSTGFASLSSLDSAYSQTQDFCDFNSYMGSYHLGEDMTAGAGNTDLGHPVFAVGDGIVSYVADLGWGWGWMVVVRHEAPPDQPWTDPAGGPSLAVVNSFYAHVDNVLVGFGQEVAQGEQLAQLGNGGGQFTEANCSSLLLCAHLHFEMRKGDSLICGPGPGYSSPASSCDTDRVDPSDFIAANPLATCASLEVLAPISVDTVEQDVPFDVTWDFSGMPPSDDVCVRIFWGPAHDGDPSGSDAFANIECYGANDGSVGGVVLDSATYAAGTDYYVAINDADGLAATVGPYFSLLEGAVVCTDVDGDGYGLGPDCLGEDCDDAEPLAWTGRFESWSDGVDNNCNNYIDEVYVDDQSSFSTGMSFASGATPISNQVVIEAGTYSLGGAYTLGDGVHYIGVGSDSVQIDLLGGYMEAAHPGTMLTGLAVTNGGGYGSGARGGAIYINGQSLALDDVAVTNSSADFGGGIAVYYSGGALAATSLRLEANNADQGGGLFLYDGTATIEGAAIVGNSATGDGGGVAVDANGTLTLTNAVVADNTSGAWGGGIQASNTTTLDNVTVVGNSASIGGGLKLFSPFTAAVSSCIFYGNTASSGGGNIDWNGSTLDMSYSLYGGGVPGDLYGGGWNDLGNNISGGTPVFQLWSADGAYNDDYALSSGSPGLDAGNPALGLDLDGSANDMGALGGPGAGLVP
jgi:hypothetical protein